MLHFTALGKKYPLQAVLGEANLVFPKLRELTLGLSFPM